jgi:predicted secreted acid phosphatase
MKRTAVSAFFGAGLIFALVVSAQSPPPAQRKAGPRLPQTTVSTTAAFPTVAAPDLHLEGDNLTEIKIQIYNYQQSGQYERDIAQVVKPAHDWVEARTASAAPNEKLAAVFDIDETALSNAPYMMDCGLCSTAAQAKLYPADRLPPIPEVRELYDFAKSKGVAVFFITGRYEAGRDLTSRTLKAAGYFGWEDLMMRPGGNSDNARTLKSGARQSIEKKGYKIILNIGDQLSDLIGGYSERTYKLPDPFYFVE